MKFNKLYNLVGIMAGMAMIPLAGCSDDDMSKSVADYDPNYKGTIGFETADFTIESEGASVDIIFSSDLAWTASVYDESEGEGKCSWATVSPASGDGGEDLLVTVKCQPYDNLKEARVAKVQILTEKGATQVFTIKQNYKIVILDPADIPNYEKYICPSAYNEHFEKGAEYMLRHDAYYSWHRMKQSEHFFVFWSPEFGDDPNGPDVPTEMKVDIDDLLEKAEHFFQTNVINLKMATLGQSKSMLDNYKMQIYIIYQDEWLATGSGYDDKIGALWVNPSTCHPVGSTIAHEIGHSFQYQTYADRVRCQGAVDDKTTGFRYGFYGPLNEGKGGCAYWEQCAQWQAQRDYPNEQFESYNFQVWLANCHRHFHHEWQRYASYWLQSYFVQKHGVEAYGRIWTESMMPEDAIMAYTRLYNGNNYATTREELFDYAMRMATYDIDGAREYSAGYQDLYRPVFVRTGDNTYRISYGSCPGSTGFNIISLTVPPSGGQVRVTFKGLEYGASLAKGDKSNIVDGDGKIVGKPTNYNAVGGAENMGWRYGFVSMKGDVRNYGAVGTASEGNLTYTVPAGSDYLYLVVQGSPEIYMDHGWDDDEVNDVQFPYEISLRGTDLKYYEEPAEAQYEVVDGELHGSLTVSVAASNTDWMFGTYDVAEPAVLDFLGMTEAQFASALVIPEVGVKQVPADGKIVVLNEESDGTLNDMPTANVGYWVNKEGNAVSWGNGHNVYYELSGTSLQFGKLGAESAVSGETRTLRPVFLYTDGATTKIVRYTLTYKFK